MPPFERSFIDSTGVTKVQVAQTSQILLQVREAVEIFYTQDRVCRFFPAEGLC